MSRSTPQKYSQRLFRVNHMDLPESNLGKYFPTDREKKNKFSGALFPYSSSLWASKVHFICEYFFNFIFLLQDRLYDFSHKKYGLRVILSDRKYKRSINPH